jgi:protein-disulfide isomerase
MQFQGMKRHEKARKEMEKKAKAKAKAKKDADWVSSILDCFPCALCMIPVAAKM